MILNPPVLLYDKHHHPLWILRRLWPRGKMLLLSAGFPPTLTGLMWFDADGMTVLWVAAAFVVVTLAAFAPLGYVLLDWRTRHIRLYSDGRLEYQYGIWDQNVINAPMRFGVVRYRYHDRIGKWLDCADVYLPFDAGVIPDVADFEEFWDLAQGR